MKTGLIMILNDIHSVNNLQKLLRNNKALHKSHLLQNYMNLVLCMSRCDYESECLNTVSKIHSVISDCVTNLVLTKL